MRQPILFAAMLLMLLPAFGQVCIPDSTITAGLGIFPSRDDGIPPAQVNLLYEVVSTIRVPADTVADVFGSPQQLLIDSIVLETLLGLPAWLTYACEPPSCGFVGGDSGCVLFTGTPPPGEGGETYSIGFITRTYARLAALPSFQIDQVDSVQDYYLLYVAFGVGVEEQKLEIALYPNPVAEILTLLLPDAGVQYQAIDMQGRTMVNAMGHGQQQIDVRHWPVGLYQFRFWDGACIHEQKIAVVR